jgi:hypothetical protein
MLYKNEVDKNCLADLAQYREEACMGKTKKNLLLALAQGELGKQLTGAFENIGMVYRQ